ncbi:MAG: RsmD family RNA methyltransferase, partial [Akkermansiaceae bacterium]
LIFADPPYLKHEGGQDFIAELLACEPLAKLLAPDGILVLEDPPRNQRGDQEPWELIDQRKYGSCGILFYQT